MNVCFVCVIQLPLCVVIIAASADDLYIAIYKKLLKTVLQIDSLLAGK